MNAGITELILSEELFCSLNLNAAPLTGRIEVDMKETCGGQE